MLRRLVLPVYLPVLLVNGGTAMLVPILPLYLASVGLSESELGVVLAAAGLGGMVSQVAIGRVLVNWSETTVMVLAVALIGITVASLGLVAGAVALAALRLGSGVGSAGWLLSRQTFLTRTVETTFRGRAMATFGGTTRVAFFVGPALGGVLAERYGFSSAFATSAAMTAAGIVPILVWQGREDAHRRTIGLARATPDLPAPTPTPTPNAVEDAEAGAPRTPLRDHAGILAIAGLGQVLVIAARQGRFLILPLIGSDLGLTAGEIGALVSVGAFADLVLFPLSGLVMDRYGRLFAVGPAFAVMGGGLFLLAAAASTTMVGIAAVVIGIGNGLGSGSMLTLSSDLAPRDAPSEFLAALGTIRDAGRIVGPIVVGVIADTLGLASAAATLGALSLAAVAIFVFGVGETRTPTRV
jgi:MFS family permease